MTIYEISVKTIWLSKIENGSKKVEGRLNKGIFKKLKVNDTVIWYYGNKKVKTKIDRITKYNNFYNYLINEGLRNTVPKRGVNTIKDAENIYYEYYTKEKEKEHGVLAIELSLIN